VKSKRTSVTSVPVIKREFQFRSDINCSAHIKPILIVTKNFLLRMSKFHLNSFFDIRKYIKIWKIICTPIETSTEDA